MSSTHTTKPAYGLGGLCFMAYQPLQVIQYLILYTYIKYDL